tara:strand:+ start:2512 stop:2895 length:384 start_codon:yes stop_codon:yes gene_type:complete
MPNKIARIHVNQHVIKANAKNGENNPVFTIKQGGKNTYAHNVKVIGEMELVYSPNKPLSCGAKVWIETRGDIEVDSKKMSTLSSNDTKPVVINVPKNISAKGLVKVDFEFLRKKQIQIKNKNKLLAI